MVSIGLTGNIASGKSHIAEMFRSLGVVVQDSDKVSHSALEDEARAEIKKQFGTTDRKELGRIVFTNDAELKKLEAILHPIIRKRNLIFLREHQDKICLIEIPLLFETNAEEIFDHVVYVDVNEETQKERALARGLTEEKLQHVLSRQHKIPPQEKRKRADFVIDNNKGADTLAQIKEILTKVSQ